MGAEARAEGGEPPVVSGGRVVGFEGFLQSKQDGGAAHVAVAAEDFPHGREVVGRKFSGEGVDYVFATGVGKDASDSVGIGGRNGSLVQD